VILVDANVLIYAVDADSPNHAKARRWLEAAFAGDEIVGLPWVALTAFLRLVTRSGIFNTPLSPERACAIVDDWLALPMVRAIGPGEQHWPLMRSLLHSLGTAGNLTTDAHIAALALENRAKICTCDHDFRRFAGVGVVDPLD